MGEVNDVSDVEAEALVTSTQRLKTKAAEQRRRAEQDEAEQRRAAEKAPNLQRRRSRRQRRRNGLL